MKKQINSIFCRHIIISNLNTQRQLSGQINSFSTTFVILYHFKIFASYTITRPYIVHICKIEQAEKTNRDKHVVFSRIC